MNVEKLKQVHSLCSHNRDMIESSRACSCFYCGEFYSSENVHEYVDDEMTALCPACGIDSVIPVDWCSGWSKEIIKDMYEYYFVEEGEVGGDE